jgi:cytochrome c-type biogenesis protein
LIALFDALSRMLLASAWAALAGALLWGIASVLLSPCHLAGIPLVVGFLSGQKELSRGKAVSLSALFALGNLITIALIGLVTGLLGRILGDLGGITRYLTFGLLVLVGLYLLGLLPIPLGGLSFAQRIRGRGIGAALLLGLVFGAALGPCSFAFMAPVIGIAFQAAPSGAALPAGLFTAYAAGHCLVIVLAGSSMQLVRRGLRWNESSKGAVILKRICGLLVIAIAVYLLVK